MYCLLKMSTTSNFLRSASQSQQQMLYHQNHRNLLFLRHPFRTYHSLKTNNNAKCCFPLDNLANKKCILIQSHGFRYKAKSNGNTFTNSNKDDEHGTESSKMSAQQFLSKFETKFAEYKATHPMRIFFNLNGRKQFVDKFNNEHAKSGYKIEWDWKAFGKFILIWVIPVSILTVVEPSILYSVFPGDVAKKHVQIVKQPPITFDQFVEEYLPSGKIDKIIYYQEKNLFVALIHRGALINGEPFIGRPGLHVHLNLSFHRFPPIIPMPPLFVLERRIRVEEARIGLKKPTKIIHGNVEFDRISQDDLSTLLFWLPFSIVCTGMQFYVIKKIMRKQFWHVIPLNPKKK